MDEDIEKLRTERDECKARLREKNKRLLGLIRRMRTLHQDLLIVSDCDGSLDGTRDKGKAAAPNIPDLLAMGADRK